MATNDMMSLLRVAYYGLMVGAFLFLLLWEDGSPLTGRIPSRRRHVLRNLALFVCVVAVADGLVGVWLLDIQSRLTITPPGLLTPLGLPVIAQVVVAFVLMDLATYGVHRLFHAHRWLWLIHSVHHSDGDVDVSTSVRHHPVEVAADVAVKLALYLLLGLPLWIEAARTLLINPLSMAQHANIAYPAWVERPLRWLLVTPAMHRVHHLPGPRQTNSNYGQCFSVWDRIFGSYHPPEPRLPPRFGLANLAGEPFQSIPGMLLTPWRARRIATL
ncbi:MAG TPA: sterol desaturase family protein [Casimicrobiaceae bacterium]|jgi:sterol desaturase/sphingolipid hydroxylase (fatty acid hydroxylase superfamily)